MRYVENPPSPLGFRGFIDAAIKRLTQMVHPRGPGSGFSGSMFLDFLNRLNNTRIDYEKLVDPSVNSAVMASIGWVQRTFPEAPIMLEQRDSSGDWNLVEDHPFLDLMANPNDFYDGITLTKAVLADYLISGNAYTLLVRGRGGQVINQWWAPSTVIEPRGTSTTFITHYEYRVNGSTTDLEPSDVVHFRDGLDPRNPRKGLSPMASLFREIFTDDEAANMTAALLHNSGVPGLLISPDTTDGSGFTAGPDDVQATKEYFKEHFGGDSRGEALIMGAPTKVQQFGFSPQQMDMRQLRRIPEERVTAIIGIPAIVAGLGAGLDRSTFSNFAEAREAAFENMIVPLQRAIGLQLHNQLLRHFVSESQLKSWRVGYDLSNVRVLQEDENAKAERWWGLLQNGVATRAEARLALGLEPQPGDEVYLVPIRVQELPQGEIRPLEPPEPEPTEEEGDEEEELEAAGLRALFPCLKSPACRQSGETFKECQKRKIPEIMRENPDMDQRQAVAIASSMCRKACRENNSADQKQQSLPQRMLVLTLRRDAERLEAALSGRMNELFDDLGRRAARSARRHLEGTRGFIPTRKQGDEIIAERILSDINVEAWAESNVRPAYEAHYLLTAETTAGTVRTVLGASFDLDDARAQRIIATGGRRVGLLDLPQKTRNSLLSALAQGRLEGEGVAALSRRIRSTVSRGPWKSVEQRATVIARTETKYAQNLSAIESYQASGVINQVEIFDAQLGPTDADCEARAGRVVEFSEAQQILDEEHPNGTLTLAPVV